MNLTPKQRSSFLSRVAVKPDHRGCREFEGYCNPQGYGRVKVGSVKDGTRQTVPAQRVAFLIEYGFLPEVVRHSCDNPPCCNPKHLVPGDHKDNAEDRVERGRQNDQRGSANHQTNLTEEDVYQIKHNTVGMTNKEVGELYNVNHSTISYIRSGKTWSHVE